MENLTVAEMENRYWEDYFTELKADRDAEMAALAAEREAHDARMLIYAYTAVVLCDVGFITNVVLVLRVITDKLLHSSTFTAIAALGICDAMLLLATMTYNICNVFYIDVFTMVAMSAMTLLAWSTSAAHVALLAMVRYLLLVHPLRSTLWVSNTRIMIASMGIWMLCGIPVIVATLLDLLSTGVLFNWNTFALYWFGFGMSLPW
jgi:hypothetical protein